MEKRREPEKKNVFDRSERQQLWQQLRFQFQQFRKRLSTSGLFNFRVPTWLVRAGNNLGLKRRQARPWCVTSNAQKVTDALNSTNTNEHDPAAKRRRSLDPTLPLAIMNSKPKNWTKKR
ncbi:unnamed protein product [Notodromas monacha]|uniref:Uncharacterized protein n=1 Tax=Notodromas monacha TaxID=399045 RepID=A0A7R9BW41_9CRUS|nr:unnamed protein product [Notodromas monacha]CAG0921202.1 unnamed protein product [Notodromas monacha]